jgi:hypothetical protein
LSGDDVTGGGAPTFLDLIRRANVRNALISAVFVVVAFGLLTTDTQALQSVLLGAGSGSLIAALALGVVVTYRGSGVVNIATGAMAMYASYVFNSLNASGELLLIGWTVPIGDPLSLVPALLVTIGVIALWGGLLYLLVFAPSGRLRRSPSSSPRSVCCSCSRR